MEMSGIGITMQMNRSVNVPAVSCCKENILFVVPHKAKMKSASFISCNAHCADCPVVHQKSY